MLDELEAKVASVIGDALTSRAHTSVVRPPAPRVPTDLGRGTVRVGVSRFEPQRDFRPSRDRIERRPGGGFDARRVLSVAFELSVEVTIRPQTDALPAARRLLLEDLARVAHALDGESMRDGRGLRAAAPDPGFEVTRFLLRDGGAGPDLDGEALIATLTYDGHAFLWPVEPPSEEGEIADVESTVVPLPVSVEVGRVPLAAGESTTLRIATSGISTERRLALAIVSDRAPADRGRIESGVEGPETDVRLVPVTAPDTVVSYRAPSDVGSTRFEVVAIFLARDDGTRGALIGTQAIELTEADA